MFQQLVLLSYLQLFFRKVSRNHTFGLCRTQITNSFLIRRVLWQKIRSSLQTQPGACEFFNFPALQVTFSLLKILKCCCSIIFKAKEHTIFVSGCQSFLAFQKGFLNIFKRKHAEWNCIQTKKGLPPFVFHWKENNEVFVLLI